MINYQGKLVLAPMVRSGELPTRLLSLKYGADLVWGPEVVDKKIITCSRRINNHMVEFVDEKNKVVFNTYRKIESGKLIFQLGSATPELAVKAGLKVIQDVDGIDLNCGCPKNFSIHSGMGAALLSNSNLLCDILKHLVENVGNPFNKPISCKIRLLHKSSKQESLDLIEKICQTGIKNLTLHCRTRDMRNRELPIHDFLPEIIELTKKHNISFIINGNLMNRLDYIQLQQKYGDNISGMIAESAESNPSCFSTTPVPWNQIIKEFLTICIKFNNHVANSKYILLNQIPSKSSNYQMFAKLKTNQDLFDACNKIVQDKFYDKIKFKYLQKDKLYSLQEYKDLIGNNEANPVDWIQQELDNIPFPFPKKRHLPNDDHDHDDDTNKKKVKTPV